MHYNSNKGAIDASNEISHKSTTQTVTLRWLMTLFYHMIEIAAINSYKIWTVKNVNYEYGNLDARRRPLLQLGKVLAKENMVFIFGNNNGLKATTEENILKITSKLQPENTTRQAVSQGRCGRLVTYYYCVRVSMSLTTSSSK